MIFQNTSSAILVGFGFGGSLLALFLRVGGGIFTKAADVGADLVGKVEAGIPEDDPRNPATIADNVGDNVGDCAGMAADLFESYEVTLVASIILGVAAFRSIDANPALGLIFPVAARAIGVVASIVGVYAVKAKEGETNALKPINRGFLTAGILTVIGTAIVALGYVGNDHDNEGWKVFGAVVIGLVLAQVVSRLTEYFTGTEYAPVQEIAEAARTGPATTVLSGISSGLESSVYAVIAIAIALGVAIALGGGNLQFSLYLVALTGMGMLATTGVVVSEDTFGPVADNAAGIAEMSGEFHGPPERIMVSLDAVGNTTKAVTKGFAIGSAVIAAVALFASYIETIGSELGLKDAAGNILEGTALFRDTATQINVADPKIFIGLLIGGAVPFLFSALAIRAVGRTAAVVVQEVRRQFADGKIMAGTKRPDYGPVIDICTAASLRELATPALLAVLTPVIIGFGINYLALGAFLAAVILTGQLMANFLSDGGARGERIARNEGDRRSRGRRKHPHIVRIDDLCLRDAIVIFAARRDDVHLVLHLDLLERTKQAVAMGREPDVAAPLPRKRRIRKVPHRVAKRLLVVPFGNSRRQLQPRNIDATDELARLELRHIRETFLHHRRAIDRDHLLDADLCLALIPPRVESDQTVKEQTCQAEGDERPGRP